MSKIKRACSDAYTTTPGGKEVLHDKREILVMTPQSPLGEQLLGRKQGDVLKLNLAGAQNQYRVTAVV